MCTKMWYTVALYLMPFVTFIDASDAPVFLVDPVSTAGVDGRTVNFTCTANNTVTILYRVNDTSAADVAISRKGFHELQESMMDGVTTRVLSVAVSSLYNNTEILCRAIGVFNVDSTTAILTVQGLLASVVDLSYCFINSSTVNMSWSPPFTLPGTDITGYNISVTSNGTTTNYFTSNSYYELLLTDVTNSPCKEIIITVSGYNGLDGEKESLTGIYLPSVPSSDVDITVSISVKESFSLIMIINVSDLQCIGDYPSSINLFLVPPSNESFKNIPLPEATNSVFTITDITSVNEDKRYTATVSFMNLAGYFTINRTTEFNSFGVQSVTITDTTDGRVCLECVFSSLSAETGCTCTVISTIVSSKQYSESFTRSDDTASGCIDIPGINGSEVFNISITDQGDEAVAVVLDGVNVSVAIIPRNTSSTVSLHSENIKSTSSRTISISSDQMSPSMEPMQSNSTNTDVIIAAVVSPIATILVILAIIHIVGFVIVYHKGGVKRKKTTNKNSNVDKQSTSQSSSHGHIGINSSNALLETSFAETSFIRNDSTEEEYTKNNEHTDSTEGDPLKATTIDSSEQQASTEDPSNAKDSHKQQDILIEDSSKHQDSLESSSENSFEQHDSTDALNEDSLETPTGNFPEHQDPSKAPANDFSEMQDTPKASTEDSSYEHPFN